jgi:hypothetical protein
MFFYFDMNPAWQLLRAVATVLGLHGAAAEPKRAIQVCCFGRNLFFFRIQVFRLFSLAHESQK